MSVVFSNMEEVFMDLVEFQCHSSSRKKFAVQVRFHCLCNIMATVFQNQFFGDHSCKAHDIMAILNYNNNDEANGDGDGTIHIGDG
jgi:hypothetical protein